MPPEADRDAGQELAMRRIVVGAGPQPQALDAARLADILASISRAEVTLVAIEPLGPTATMHETEAKVEARLRSLETRMAARTRTAVERDLFVARGLARVALREHADLIVLGSSRHAAEGRVRIGARVRQLLADAYCSLAVAPRGLGSHAPRRLTAIGVGYDGSTGSREALRQAEWLARAADARLRVRAVADDRLPYAGWTPTGDEGVNDLWDAAVAPNVEWLRTSAEEAIAGDRTDVLVEVRPGSPPEELSALSREVDLLVIGSGRLGAPVPRPAATAEELMRQARCAVLLVPSRSAAPDAQPATRESRERV
ncbi:MAG TPA: universal stress protein [Solirubrobacteraceae bacterium]|nr:universal stress protein [Solirubrobacteraceae bacterium]